MLFVIQIITIVGMFFITYVAFLSFGKPRKNLLFSKLEKEEWDKSIPGGIGKWFTLTNIVGTLSSLATAYLFFIGNSKLFGWIIFACSVTIFAGAYITNKFTKRILANEYLQSLFERKEQVAGVISTLFWRPNDEKAQRTAHLVKWLSIGNIIAIIWLEFSFFSDIAGRLFAVNSLYLKVTIVFICSFAVIFFTVKYGLRGFVFADAFQSPLIAISALALVGGCFFLQSRQTTSILSFDFIRPILPLKECIFFLFHVIFLNIFFVLVTEGHWLRVWIFGSKVTQMQTKSILATGLIWAILAFVGFFSYVFSNGKVGEDAVISLVQGLTNLSPIFLVFFWLGGIAALYSTADAQIYSLLLVHEFNSNDGTLHNKLMDKTHPFVIAIVLSGCYSLAYFFVRYFNIPFDKIVFIIMPFSLNIIPAFIRAYKGYQQEPWMILLSLFLYLLCSIFGLFHNDTIAWTLAAAMMPILVSFVALKK